MVFFGSLGKLPFLPFLRSSSGKLYFDWLPIFSVGRIPIAYPYCREYFVSPAQCRDLGSVQRPIATLQRMHEKCVSWANRHDAKFAPDKYKLMHFTRRRKNHGDPHDSTITFNGHTVELCKVELLILGYWFFIPSYH